MPGNDIDLLIEAARTGGDIARLYWGKSPKTWEKEAAAGPVTEADLAVNNHFHQHLMGERPDFGWLSEESEDNSYRLGKERVFIIDPIDGTRSFIAKEKTWAHSLAIAENGRVTDAVVYLPLLDKLYHAQNGRGAHLNGQPITVSDREQFADATVLATRNNFDPSNWKFDPPALKRKFRPSLAYRMALVAEGRYDAMLTLRDTWEWDVAAGTLIAQEAGGVVTDQHGSDPIFNQKHPAIPGLIAGSHRVHDGIYSQLA